MNQILLLFISFVVALCGVYMVQSKLEDATNNPWYCSLNGWNFGEWSDDGHIFYPYYRSIINTDNSNTSLRKEPDSYIIYNTESLRSCLRNKTLVLFGPSYMRDVWHSLVDLLHGFATEDLESYRHYAPVPEKNITLLGPGFERVEYVGTHGFRLSWPSCLYAIERASNNVLLADNLIWDIKDDSEEKVDEVKSDYFLKLAEFLYLCKKNNVHLVWMSQMSAGVHVSKKGVATSTGIPDQFLHQQSEDRIMNYLNLTIKYLHIYNFPFLDVYHMTRNCVSDEKIIKRLNDPVQGCVVHGHSHWYTARMKFQVFANYFCRDCIKK